MPTASIPEVRALLFVLFVVLTSAAVHTVASAFERLAAADAKASFAASAAQGLKEKVDKLESQLLELRDELNERR